ncbi:MAG: dehydrogenase, partial [Desulfobulbaceae bacterium]|nr:dehydrogenase [Desulfobulbaceae bacterium]
PIIFERGKIIEERSVDVQQFINTRALDPESNIQFGEGGAGSYSDGKLFSRRDNNTSFVNRVLQTYIKFGAPEEIGYISKPHLGTDVLCKIVRNIRRYILERGGEIYYGAKMTDILISDAVATGVVINEEQEYLSSRIYIALGHSARDTVEMMHEKGVVLEQRPISVGVRIEHPVETINVMRHGNKYSTFKKLGAATYSLNYTNQKIKRGVYTFCMCPGGEVVNASAARGQLVVNGMSYSQRSSPFSNAALVVSCHVDDYPSAGPLAGFEFQKNIERKAFDAGGGKWEVPAQNLMHFLGDSDVVGLNENSYKMGAVPADLKDILPTFAVEELRAAFAKWKKEVPLFVSNQAILLGAETRTSSPVRITRNERFESVNIKNLYPIGEGSGYTGGITSSAADAIKAVEMHMLHDSR